jgi:mono/diheme cytochrome c family protein
LQGLAQTLLYFNSSETLLPGKANDPISKSMTKRWIPLTIFGAFAILAASSPPHASSQQGEITLGRQVFLTYCSGCHGFDGLAYYPPAPSFAMGDRLAKSDAELMRSIFRGKGAMPSWEDKLPAHWLEQALGYIRHMARKGKIDASGHWPDYYFIFPPLGGDLILDWHVPPR